VARRAAAFYLATLLALATMLLWLYGTTPLPLSFLLPTSADRTVGLFMSLTPFATAHLLWELLGRPEARPVRAGRTAESFDSDRTVPGPQMQSR
jgi:predicted small integral membrane protein